jgi:multiple sugar transport system permease protein
MLTLLITIWTFGRAFTIIYLLTEGGPAGCSETIVIRSYLEAFKFFHIGTASALGVLVLAISLAFSIAYLALAQRRANVYA